MPLSPEALAAKSASTDAEKEKEKERAAKGEPDLNFKEPPPKMIGAGFEKRELRRLTPEEKAVMRLKVNTVMGIMGAMILSLAMYILTRL